MKKDVIIAVLIGFVIGIAAAFSAIKITSFLQISKLAKIEEVKITVTPAPALDEKKVTPALEISSPSDGTILETETVEVSGKSQDQNIIVVENELETKIVQTSNEGTFSAQIKLAQGQNNIQITSYANEKEEETKNIQLFYFEEKL